MNEKNIILLFLSDYKSTNKDEEYWFQDHKYIGNQTNDAPVKLLLDLAKREEKPITDIFCIATNKVIEDIVLEDGSSYDRFEREVKNWAKELGYSGDISVSPILYDEEKLYVKQRTRLLYERISEELSETILDPEATSFYIDYTGGFRDAAFFMTVIIRYLEFSGIKCRKIVYSYRDNDPKIQNNLYDITFIYETFQLINGTSEFVNTGSASILKGMYEDTDNSDIKEILEGLIDFSNKMSLCKIEDLDNAIQSLSGSLKKTETYANSMEENLFNDMFASLIPLIRTKMGIKDDETKVQIPGLIQWCLDNNMLQQAVTLYIEKMPEYYLDNNFFPYALHNWDEQVDEKKLAMGESQVHHKVYTVLYSTVYEKGDPVEVFKQILQNIDTEEIKSRFDEREQGRKIIKETLELQGQYPDYARAIRRLRGILSNISGLRPGEPSVTIYGNKLKRSVIGAYEQIMNRDYFIHYLLFDDKAGFTEYNREKEKMKKLEAIRRVDNLLIITDREKEDLKKVMTYYLMMKIIRNGLNHARGGAANNGDLEVLAMMRDDGMIDDIDIFNYSSIKNITSKGLKASLDCQRDA